MNQEDKEPVRRRWWAEREGVMDSQKLVQSGGHWPVMPLPREEESPRAERLCGGSWRAEGAGQALAGPCGGPGSCSLRGRMVVLWGVDGGVP